MGSTNIQQIWTNEPDLEATPEPDDRWLAESNTLSMPLENEIKSNNIKLEPLFIRVSVKISWFIGFIAKGLSIVHLKTYSIFRANNLVSHEIQFIFD